MNVSYARVLFSGHVQGVGFRYQTRELAMAYEVAGYVRNTADGRVELEIEGEAEEIEAFLQALEGRMSGFIRGRIRHDGKRESLLQGFTIAR